MGRLLSLFGLFVAAAATAAPLKDKLPTGEVARLGTPVAPVEGKPQIGAVNALAFLNDNMLVVGTGGGWRIWDVDKRRARQDKSIGGPVFAIANDPHRLFVGSIQKLHVVESHGKNWEPAASWDSASERVNVLALSPDGRRVAFSDGERRLSIFDVKSGKVAGTIEFANKPVAASMTANGRILAVVTRDGAARIYNLSRDAKLDLAFTKRVARSDYVAAGFSPDGRLFAVSSAGRVSILDSASGRPMHSIERHFGEGDVRCLAFSPDGRLIAIGRNSPESGVRIADVVSGSELSNLSGHLGDVTALAFSPDGKLLASGSNDTSVLVSKTPVPMPAPKSMSAQDSWENLDSLDAEIAYRCTEELLAHPEKSVDFLGARFRERPAEQIQIQRWVRELDHDEFRVREAARRGLTKAGLRAAAALTDPKRKPLGPEGEQRVRAILDAFEAKGMRIPEGGLFGEPLRIVRAVRVLEIIGTKEARGVLEEFAHGPSKSRLTSEAKAALDTWVERRTH